MSIVPKEVLQDIRETWPAREMGLLEYAIERAAEWALELAAKVCDVAALPAESGRYGDPYEQGCKAGRIDAAEECGDAIRALISPEGKAKGGESDGQG
jgi:hypothetical protein